MPIREITGIIWHRWSRASKELPFARFGGREHVFHRIKERWTWLVAEDQESEAELMAHAVRSLAGPPLLRVVPDGNGVIRYLKGEEEFADRKEFPWPRLLILDLKMPACSGFDVLQWIKENPEYRVVPSIIWSGSSDPEDVKHAFCLGAHGYLTKPASFEVFKKMLENTVAFWMDCLVPPPPGEGPSCAALHSHSLRILSAETDKGRAR